MGVDGGWKCSQCEQPRQAEKAIQIWMPPQYLIIQLKRFEFDRSGERRKIETYVDFPLQNFDIRPYCSPNCNLEGSSLYDLIGICNHFGRLAFGHYTAYAKRWWSYPGDAEYNDGDAMDKWNGWLSFDDENVRRVINPDNVKTASAYILFYKRQI